MWSPLQRVDPKSRALILWQGVLRALPSNNLSPPSMFSVFNRPCSIAKGWQGVLDVPCCGTAPRHCWALHPSGVPSLAQPSWHKVLPPAAGSQLALHQKEHAGLGIYPPGPKPLSHFWLQWTPTLELPTAPANNMGKKGRWFFLMTVVGEPSGSKYTAASHAPAPQEEHQSEERGFPLAL